MHMQSLVLTLKLVSYKSKCLHTWNTNNFWFWFNRQPIVGNCLHLSRVVLLIEKQNFIFFSWKATGLLPLNSHITNNGQTLVIMNFKAADNGQYICVTSDGQQFAHYKFTLHACNSGTYPFTIHPITLSTSTHPTTTYGWTNTHGINKKLELT